MVNAAIQNAGQTCSAGSRLLLENAAYDEFVGMVAERFHTWMSARRSATSTAGR